MGSSFSSNNNRQRDEAIEDSSQNRQRQGNNGLSLQNPRALMRSDGTTPLHQACIGDASLESIDSILLGFPLTCLVKDNEGRTPLYLACGIASDAVILTLLRCCPGAASVKDNKDKTPLVVAIMKNRSIPVIHALLSQSCSKRNNFDGKTPLDIFCLHWINYLKDRALQLSKNNLSNRLRYIYDILSLLLKVSAYGSVKDILPDSQNWLILHASLLDQSCPLLFFRLILQLNLHQAKEMDTKENLPIHIAASSPLNFMRLSQCKKCRFGNNDEEQTPHSHYWKKMCQACFYARYLNESFEKVDRFSWTIKDLILEFPGGSSIPNKKGRLPLSLAIESMHSYVQGVDSIFLAEPRALRTRDMPTHMYPFMLAAKMKWVKNATKKKKRRFYRKKKQTIKSSNSFPRECILDQFTTCYNLLIEDPSIINIIVEDIKWPQLQFSTSTA